MRNSIAFLAISLVFVGCAGPSGGKGELVGVGGKQWHPEQPYGTTLVPGGAFIMGRSDADMAYVEDAPTKTVTVRSFYMDETEITNSEYRQFVEWVKDSIIRVKLAVMADESGQTNADGKGAGIGSFAFSTVDTEKMTPYEKYMYDNYYSIGTDKDPNAYKKLNRSVKLFTATKSYPDAAYVEVMDSLYVSLESSVNGIRMMDARKLTYNYSWLDADAAVKSKKSGRKDFIRKESVAIYPDTTAWLKDFSYSYNEPMHNDYFWHDAYSDYPVVGVNWNQAKSFCSWRTKIKNDYIKASRVGVQNVNTFRLPTEAEWEYAARGGLESATYPWGGPYTKNQKGCFLANFKPDRGDYSADGALYTVEAQSYDPNGFNLYNMSGNVSEWTSSSYDPGAYDFISSMNPTVKDAQNKRKVIRGGSWKDVAYFLQVATRDYEYADSSRSFIGFRTVLDYMGTGN